FAHCRRSSTAASRRSLASVPVPVAQVVLSHLLGILALVSRYLTNKLIPREPLPDRRNFRSTRMLPRYGIRHYPLGRRATPKSGAGYPRLTAPFATSAAQLPRRHSFDLHA